MSLAVSADELGPPANYRLVERALGPLADGHVRVAIKAVGLAHADILLAGGKYQVVPQTPYIPGTECAGIVEAVGPGVTDLEPGMPISARAIGGLLAQHADLPAKSLLPLRGNIDLDEAAVLTLAYSTAWHALYQRADLKASETLLVLGAGGGTGTAAVQVGRQIGAHVIASASTPEKRDIALQSGANVVIDSRSATWRDDLKAANGGRAVDVVFDPVGGAATEPAFRSLAWGGRHLVIGFVDGISSLRTNLALLKGGALVGVDVRQFEMFEPEKFAENLAQIQSSALAGILRPPIAGRYPLAQFARAMEAVASGRIAGRIIINP